VRQAGDGLLPEHPSISWHEPTAVDPTRAPAGRAVVRLQVLDVPHTPRRDAAGTRYGTHGWDPAAGPGDHLAGDNSLVQAFTQRPIPAHGGGHRAVVPGVWLIGAATWPGPGVSGTSGRAVAQALIDARIGSRATAKADA
jgi:phytoene dehydrogenase-like protein